uniref:L-type lectin-like domain-containing protein n=1 Tax=Haptolina ericina TaxID=156174 RepID=A0A7S3AMB7_9EUKA
MLEVRASGTSPHLYGDGLAIWLVTNPDHIEGDVFGREDHWKGLGLFFDTFQNLDHSHHHKHPYIYAMMNDGTKGYIPDAEKPDPTKQVLPGAVENSGCSYDFRYAETREDVSVLNHTRVHMTYKGKALKVRIQQTSIGQTKEWYNCFDMQNVDIPPNAYFGVSSATGDLVDNHDIIQFNVRSLAGVENAEEDYDKWAKLEQDLINSKLEEFDMRPAEALQRDYQRVLRAQAAEIKTLHNDMELLKQSLEFTLASMSSGLETQKEKLDDKSHDMREVSKKMEEQTAVAADVQKQKDEIEGLKKEIELKASGGGGWRLPFFILFALIVAVGGIGYNRYRKLSKSHFL